MTLSFDRWFNVALAKQPMNWAIVWVIASLWLLCFHVIMTGWAAMSGKTAQAAFGNPGQISAAPAGTANFSVAGTLGNDPVTVGAALSGWTGGGGHTWTDGFESKYAEDGWIGNP